MSPNCRDPVLSGIRFVRKPIDALLTIAGDAERQKPPATLWIHSFPATFSIRNHAARPDAPEYSGKIRRSDRQTVRTSFRVKLIPDDRFAPNGLTE